MSTPPARKAKYCPRCGAMTFPDTVQCTMCGHRFHTGVEQMQSTDAPKPADDPLNRTQMFEMPPALSARPPRNEAIPTPLDPQPVRAWHRRLWMIPAIAVVVVLIVIKVAITLVRHYTP